MIGAELFAEQSVILLEVRQSGVAHHDVWGFSSDMSAKSQTRANAHQRSAVGMDIPRAAAASGVERPAKKRRTTSSALRGSGAARRVMASSSASRCSGDLVMLMLWSR